MLTIARTEPSPDDVKDWLATVPGYIQGLTRVDGEPTRLYDYQVDLMTCASRFAGVEKSRQTGLSFGFAAEALAKAQLRAEHTAIFVSYNLDDATEKIRHADMLYDSIPARWRKKRTTQNKTSLEFTDTRGRRSRLISLPCRDPRGKGKADVYLDELPFMRHARRIYTAAVPIISRGGGNLRLGSTPLGASGLFHEIMRGEAEKYPHFRRFAIPWWRCPEFCADVERATAEAPALPTDERVARFGTDTLRVIRASMDLDSFQQEYECVYVDEATAFIPWDLIAAATRDADELSVARTVDAFLAVETKGALYAGYDVGRRRNASELVVLERVGERLHARLTQTFENTPFAQQDAALRTLMEKRPDVTRLCIDESGMGMQLAEGLIARYASRVEGVTFSAPAKDAIGHGLKVGFDQHNVLIPADRDLMQQIHSVRKTITIAGNIRLDTDHDEKHHADKFWALALAVHAGHVAGPLAAGASIDPPTRPGDVERRRGQMWGR